MYITGAHSSKVTKNRSQPKSSIFRRSSSSPFSKASRRKPSASGENSNASKTPQVDVTFDEPLDDTGIIASLASELSLRDVAVFIENIRSRMFAPIPEKSPGMSSTRIAEVLNYRRNLPPIVTVSHIHALSKSNTVADREIVELCKAGIVRRAVIPNRGAGSDNVGDGIVLMKEWVDLVRSHPELDEKAKETYISILQTRPASVTVPATELSSTEPGQLSSTGFLTSVTVTRDDDVQRFSRVIGQTGKSSSLLAAASREASGSLAAVGGSYGGHQFYASSINTANNYNLALPNTGPFLKLTVAARQHLVNLLKKSSKYHQAPLYLLKERWDGGIAADDSATAAKKIRGEFIGVLPGKTMKWRKFYGLNFEWVLEECVGAGLMECFETGSVGLGVRLIS
jgi:hypothetical protein